jgi:hypothetical protein
MEEIHHVVNASLLSELGLESSDDATRLSTELLIIYLISDAKTGLARQMRNLMKAGLIEVDGANRNVKLTARWETQIPACILNGMHGQGWGKHDDQENMFCLDDVIRSKISSEWRFTLKGWTRRSQPDKVIYSHEEYLDRKDLFYNRIADHENEMEGIARFGI